MSSSAIIPSKLDTLTESNEDLKSEELLCIASSLSEGDEIDEHRRNR